MRKFLIIASLLILSKPSVQEMVPKMITELWRHGARSAAYNTFNQSYVDAEGPGNLVGNGQRMHYLLGRQVRKEYPSLFPVDQKNVSFSDFEVWSTDIQRTLLSAYSHMMGIYPLGTGKVTSNDVDKTKLPPFNSVDPSFTGDFALPEGAAAIPINVKVTPTDDFFMKGMKYVCKTADDKSDMLFEEEVKKGNPIQALSDKIKAAGWDCNKWFKQGKDYDLNTTGIFADVNKCYYYYEGKGMEGTDDIIDQMQTAFAIYYIASKFKDPMINKLWTTKMSQYIISKFQGVMSGKSNLKFLGFSGHEGNLFAYMLNYGIVSEECLIKSLTEKVDNCYPGPDFAANIIWELAQDSTDNQWYVKARYNGNVILKSCEGMTAEGYCKFNDFVESLNKNFILTPAEYSATCGSNNKPSGDTEKESKIWMYIAIGIAVLFAIQMIIFISYVGKAKNKNKRLNQELTGEADVFIDK